MIINADIKLDDNIPTSSETSIQSLALMSLMIFFSFFNSWKYLCYLWYYGFRGSRWWVPEFVQDFSFLHYIMLCYTELTFIVGTLVMLLIDCNNHVWIYESVIYTFCWTFMRSTLLYLATLPDTISTAKMLFFCAWVPLVVPWTRKH